MGRTKQRKLVRSVKAFVRGHVNGPANAYRDMPKKTPGQKAKRADLARRFKTAKNQLAPADRKRWSKGIRKMTRLGS